MSEPDPPEPPTLADPAWAKLEALRDCLETALTGTILGGVCRLAIEPGQVAWDHCSAFITADDENVNGQAWVRDTNQYPYTVFPTQAASARPCGFPQALMIEMGIVRCAPEPDDKGNPPSGDALTDAAQARRIDGAALLYAVCCASATDAFANTSILVGNLQPLGPQGGCVGVTLHVVIDL